MTAQPDLWSQRTHVYAERKPMGRQLTLVYSALTVALKPWWTLAELREYGMTFGIGISEAGVSARIRDLRKPCYGSHTIERRPTGRKGVFEYKMSA